MSIAKVHTGEVSSATRWKDYLELCKPRVVALMLFTTFVGMLLAAPGHVDWNPMIFGILGIALMSGSAAAINHLADRHIDALMARTQFRPLPRGNIDSQSVLVFATTLGMLGMSILILRVNMLTAILTLVSLVGYAVVYTLYLKHATPQNIVIGGAAGATPPLLGWTAVTGQVDSGALLLFLIIFTWTPPHFWALALYRKEEYSRVGVPMLPVTHGDDYTRLQITLYTVLLSLVTVLPYLTGMTGIVYLAAALILDGIFLYYVLALQIKRSRPLAIKTFVYSIVYLMLIFTALLVDHYLTMLNVNLVI